MYFRVVREKGGDVNIFDEQMNRIKLVIGKTTQSDIATFFGIRQGAVASAKRREKIPSVWLVQLVQKKMVHPDWILTGRGARFLKPVDKAMQPSDSDENQTEMGESIPLDGIPGEILDELVRRAVEQLGGKPKKA